MSSYVYLTTALSSFDSYCILAAVLSAFSSYYWGLHLTTPAIVGAFLLLTTHTALEFLCVKSRDINSERLPTLYRWLAHPKTASSFCLVIAFALTLHHPVACVALVLFCLKKCKKEVQEEDELRTKILGPDYLTYRLRMPALLPRLPIYKGEFQVRGAFVEKAVSKKPRTLPVLQGLRLVCLWLGFGGVAVFSFW